MRSERLWLQATHLFLALSIPLFLTLMLGCLQAKATKASLGEEVPSTKITEILETATGSGDLSKLKIGQYVDFINTRRVETETIDTTLGNHRIDVIDAQNQTDGDTHYTFKITDNVRQRDGSFQTVVTQDSLNLSHNAGASSLAPGSGALTHGMDDGSSTTSTTRVTFHNLQESNEMMDAPAAVRAKSNCLGLPNCQIPTHTVHFDMVQWSDEQNYTKTTLDLAFSTSTPYIPFGQGMQQLTGVLVSDCRSTYIPVQSIPVYVRDCMTLDDFQN